MTKPMTEERLAELESAAEDCWTEWRGRALELIAEVRRLRVVIRDTQVELEANCTSRGGHYFKRGECFVCGAKQ